MKNLLVLRGGWLIGSLLFCLIVAGCNGERERMLEEIDGMIYLFIVGKVEGNDEVLRDVLAEDAEGILMTGRHEYPGAAEKMGERYFIKRYDDRLNDGELYYYVKFYRPSSGEWDYYNVKVIRTEDGWRIAKNRSIPSDEMKRGMGDEAGTIVHDTEGGEAE